MVGLLGVGCAVGYEWTLVCMLENTVLPLMRYARNQNRRSRWDRKKNRLERKYQTEIVKSNKEETFRGRTNRSERVCVCVIGNRRGWELITNESKKKLWSQPKRNQNRSNANIDEVWEQNTLQWKWRRWCRGQHGGGWVSDRMLRRRLDVVLARVQDAVPRVGVGGGAEQLDGFAFGATLHCF